MGSFSALYIQTGAPAYTPATVRGAWDDTGGAVVRRGDPAKTGGGAITSVSRAETNATTEYDVLLCRVVGPPMAAQTLSGTINVLLGVRESGVDANFHWHLHVYVTQGDSDVVRGTLVNNYREAAGVNEWPTTATGIDFDDSGSPPNEVALSSLAVSAGDRLVVEIGYTARNTVTTSYTGYLNYGTESGGLPAPDLAHGGTDVTTKAGRIVFSNAITDTEPGNRIAQLQVATAGAQEYAAIKLPHLLVAAAGQQTDDNAAIQLAHLLVLVATPIRADVRVSHLLVLVASTPNPCEEPEIGEDLTGAHVAGPLLFLNYDLGGGLEGVGEVDLDDPASYYGGYKAGRLLRVSDVRRALSGPRGDYEVGRWSVRIADTERSWRAALALAPGRYFPGREAWLRMVSAAGRRAAAAPYLVGWGRVDGDPQLTAGLEVELPLRDAIGSSPAWSLDLLLPRRTIQAPEFPEARVEVRGQAVPFPYGVISDAASTTAAPVMTGNTDKDRGWIANGDGVTGELGWGDMPGPPPPTNVQLSQQDDAAASMGHNAWDVREYHVLVTSIDAEGVEGDTVPFDTNDAPSITLTDATTRLMVSWTAEATATAYRVYLCWDWYGIKCTQYIQTTGTSCYFTKNPDWVEELVITQADITPGAYLAPASEGAWYSVVAIMADGDTVLSTRRAFQYSSRPSYKRIVRVEWEAVAGALGYRVYKGGLVVPPYTQRWTLGSAVLYFDDDWSGAGAEAITGVPAAVGAYAPVYVGDVELPSDPGQTWRELLVAGCAIDEITHWYYQEGTNPQEVDQGAGVDYLIPGESGWATRFATSYRDIVGADGVTRRRTVIYARGPKGDAIAAGTATLRVNVSGIEDRGDGMGTVISDLYRQAVHFFENLVLQEYLTGDWQSPPMFTDSAVCQVHRPSFWALAEQRASELSGGYVGAWIVGAGGEQASVQEWIGRICRSGQFRIGPNRFWQLKAWAIDQQADPASWTRLEDVSEIEGASGDPVHHTAELANVLTYRYGPPLDGGGGEWQGEATLRDEGSIASYGQEFAGETLELYCLRAPGVAAAATQQALVYSRLTPVTIEPETDLRGLGFDIGDGLRYTHARGLGADGFVDRAVVVIGHTLIPATRRVRLECLDVGDMLAQGSG